jgi:hypothetical protein
LFVEETWALSAAAALSYKISSALHMEKHFTHWFLRAMLLLLQLKRKNSNDFVKL